jgi:pimeloyl-ACP methyl ester carboxylesterase
MKSLSRFPAPDLKTSGRIFLHTIMLAIVFFPQPVLSNSFEVQVTGKGAPLILIPGLGCSAEIWNGTVNRFKEEYECHVLTLAGFAGVAPIQSDWFLDQVKNDLAFYIREKKLDKPVIFGHGLGGFLALWLASAEPDIAGKLIIVDALPYLPAVFYPTATPETSAPFARQLKNRIMSQPNVTFREGQQAYFKVLITDSAAAVNVATQAALSDQATFANASYELQTIDLRTEIEKITCPVLVFASWIAYAPGQSHESMTEVFKTQYFLLRDYRLIVTDKARHFVMLDDPAGFYSDSAAFLRGN